MQLQPINAVNNTAFGAKLLIDDYSGFIRGLKRTEFHDLDKVRAFSEQELRQIEAEFEQRTQNLVGTMQLTTRYFTGSSRPLVKDITNLYYVPETLEGNRSDLALDSLSRRKEIVGICLADDMPKSVDDFVNRLIGAFGVLKNRFLQSQEIDKLKMEIKNMEGERTFTTLSKLRQNFSVRQ